MDETRYLEHDDLEEIKNHEEEIGTEVIAELSRQLRTFFNLKSAVVRTRFLRTPISLSPSEKVITPVSNKKFMDRCIYFVKRLNELSSPEKSIEERLQILMVQALDPRHRAQRGLLIEIKKTMETLFRELHAHSEKEPLKDMMFLEQACKMEALLCEVKASLNAQLSEYFSELVEHYTRLSQELVEIRGQKILSTENVKRNEKNRLKVRIAI